jgi:undecaprenyl diphosphate synthase
MDGNGRWAKKRGLPRTEGHRRGAEVFRTISTYASDIGIPFMTFYAFSTENWKRPEQEIAVIMDLFRNFLHEAEDRREENEERGFRFRFIGDLSVLPEDIRSLAEYMERQNPEQGRTTVNVAVNYGGRSEIVRAARELASRVRDGVLTLEDVSETAFADALYTSGQPDPDLIIRPSGEFRLSNFLTWQSAYSEFWFSDVLWPDFTTDDFDRALEDFAHRSRRFGGI